MFKNIKKWLSKKKNNITYIDIVLAVLGVMIVLFALLYFRRTKQVVLLELEAKPIAFSYSDVPPFYTVAGNLSEDDFVLDGFGNEVGRVISVSAPDFGGTQRYARVVVELEVLEDTRTGLYQFRSERLYINDEIELIIGNVKFTGLIRNIIDPEVLAASKQQHREIFRARVLSVGVPNWVIETYEDGLIVQEEPFGYRAEILEVLSVSPARQESYVSGSQLFFRENDRYSDVEMMLELEATCVKELCYFNKTQPLKVGNELWVQGPEYVLSGAHIQKLERITPQAVSE